MEVESLILPVYMLLFVRPFLFVNRSLSDRFAHFTFIMCLKREDYSAHSRENAGKRLRYSAKGKGHLPVPSPSLMRMFRMLQTTERNGAERCFANSMAVKSGVLLHKEPLSFKQIATT